MRIKLDHLFLATILQVVFLSGAKAASNSNFETLINKEFGKGKWNYLDHGDCSVFDQKLKPCLPTYRIGSQNVAAIVHNNKSVLLIENTSHKLVQVPLSTETVVASFIDPSKLGSVKDQLVHYVKSELIQKIPSGVIIYYEETYSDYQSRGLKLLTFEPTISLLHLVNMETGGE